MNDFKGLLVIYAMVVLDLCFSFVFYRTFDNDNDNDKNDQNTTNQESWHSIQLPHNKHIQLLPLSIVSVVTQCFVHNHNSVLSNEIKINYFIIMTCTISYLSDDHLIGY